MNPQARRELLAAFTEVTAPSSEASLPTLAAAMGRFLRALGFGALFVDTAEAVPRILGVMASEELAASFGPAVGALQGVPLAHAPFPAVAPGDVVAVDDLAGLVASGAGVRAAPLRGLILRVSDPGTTSVVLLLFGSDVALEDGYALDGVARRAAFSAVSRRLFDASSLLEHLAAIPLSDDPGVDATALLAPIAQEVGAGAAVVVEDGAVPRVRAGAGVPSSLWPALVGLVPLPEGVALVPPASLPAALRACVPFVHGLIRVDLGVRRGGRAWLLLGRREGSFSTPQMVLLRILASTLGNALDALLLRAVRLRAVEGARGLFTLGQAVAGEGDLSRISALAVQTASVLNGGGAAYLLTSDADEPSGFLLRAGHPTGGDSGGVVPDDVYRLARSSMRQRGAVRGAPSERRALAVPLLLGERPAGALVCLCDAAATSAVVVDADDEQRLRAVADYVVLAMQSTENLVEQQRRVRELVLLNEVARDCAELGLDRLMPAVASRICQLRGVVLAGLYIFDGRRALVAGVVADPAGPLSGLRLRRDRDDGIVLRALGARQARRGASEDLELGELRRLSGERGAPQALAVPLWGKHDAIGAVVVTRATAFSDDDIRLLTAIGGEIAVAVDNARLFGEVRRRAAELEVVQQVSEVMTRSLDPNEVVRETALRLSALLGCDAARIYLRDGGILRMVHHVGVAALGSVHHEMALSSEHVQRVARNGPTDFRLSDLPEPVRSALEASSVQRVAVAPLLAPGGASSASAVSGLVALGRKVSRPFSEDELRVLGAVSSQLAVALQNARLHEETRRRLEDLDVVTEAGRLLAGDGTLRDALDTVSERIARTFGTTSAAVLLLEESGRAVRLEGASALLRRSLPEHSVSFDGSSLSERVLRERRACVEPLDPRSPGIRKAGIYVPDSWAAAVPLLAGDRVIGALAVAGPPELAATEPLVARLTGLGAQLGIAIERARLDAALERSQQQLVQRERLAALGELSSLVAHEIRNPLGVIAHSLGTLGRIVDLQGDARRVYDIMREETRRLDRIVGDMLDYARPVQPQLRPVSLARVLQGALDSATATERARGTAVDTVTVTVDVDPALPEVRLDERLLHQAVVNLLSNGFQSLRGGGSLVLRARAVPVDGRTVARVEVQDDGPGMPPEVRRRLFEPFFTTKALGSGLGLAVVRRIVEAHRGTVSLETAVGQGTTFRLDLPLDPDERAASPLEQSVP